jgi:hypothetical protein
MGNEHARIRRTTAFVINQLSVHVPQLIFSHHTNLNGVAETMIKHIEGDKPPIK